jgi:putative addiction module component (TIGR02574 family)
MSNQNNIYPDLMEQIQKLSVSEKILLIENIWDSITLSGNELSVNNKQKIELDKRLADYNKSPEDGSTWEEVKNRLKSNL